MGFNTFQGAVEDAMPPDLSHHDSRLLRIGVAAATAALRRASRRQ